MKKTLPYLVERISRYGWEWKIDVSLSGVGLDGARVIGIARVSLFVIRKRSVVTTLVMGN